MAKQVKFAAHIEITPTWLAVAAVTDFPAVGDQSETHRGKV
jgi:hypothetical protein